ncbi:MAG: cytidine deaminase [Marinifilaceae bacterium]
MEKRNISIDYEQYTNSIPAQYEKLCHSAMEARSNSYSPYSGFAVGAAVLLDNGTIMSGANQENMAYPLGSCAERVALQQVAMHYPQASVQAIAICGGAGVISAVPVTPCGGCRQLFQEQITKQNADFDVVLYGTSETIIIRASSLLPLSFTL